MSKAVRFITMSMVLGLSLLTGACSMQNSSGAALYPSSDNFSLPGGYTRTIFSSNNF